MRTLRFLRKQSEKSLSLVQKSDSFQKLDNPDSIHRLSNKILGHKSESHEHNRRNNDAKPSENRKRQMPQQKLRFERYNRIGSANNST
ncbi:hypothetical protein PIB30_063509, partial [Stylosanthes scabra]|nr:hypothetical protein [Stylosanthes scabra]